MKAKSLIILDQGLWLRVTSTLLPHRKLSALSPLSCSLNADRAQPARQQLISCLGPQGARSGLDAPCTGATWPFAVRATWHTDDMRLRATCIMRAFYIGVRDAARCNVWRDS